MKKPTEWGKIFTTYILDGRLTPGNIKNSYNSKRKKTPCLKKANEEKEMATHSSVLAWRIPGTGEPGGLLSMGSHRVGHD